MRIDWQYLIRHCELSTRPILFKRVSETKTLNMHVAGGAAIFTLLLRRNVAFLHRTAICRPLFKPWVSLLPTYRTIVRCFEFLSHFRSFRVTLPRIISWNAQLESLTVEDKNNSFFRNLGEKTNPATHRHTSSDTKRLWHSCLNLKFRIFGLQIREISLKLPEHTHRHKDITAHKACLSFTTWTVEYKQWKQKQKNWKLWPVSFVALVDSLISEFQPVSEIRTDLTYERHSNYSRSSALSILHETRTLNYNCSTRPEFSRIIPLWSGKIPDKKVHCVAHRMLMFYVLCHSLHVNKATVKPFEYTCWTHYV